jgi:hypothetical protein
LAYLYNVPATYLAQKGQFSQGVPGGNEWREALGRLAFAKQYQFHRAMVHFRGWLFSPKFRYQITSWTVMLLTVSIVNVFM